MKIILGWAILSVLLTDVTLAAPKKHHRPQKAKASPAAAPSPQPVPTPPKSLLDTMAEDGATITNHILAPLDAASIPEAAISTWREDLLDEAAKQPAENQPVYNQAAYLLESWKNALRERYKLISDTRFSGAVMDTTNMDSSRKATLHLWDVLMYLRERDDARAHERRAQQKAAFFASGPTKIWADRSVILRMTIERQFQHFRELRRELVRNQASTQQPAK